MSDTLHDNGLTATDHVRLARPVVPLADALLDALRRTGIAAYTRAADDGRVELWVDALAFDDAARLADAVRRHLAHDVADLGPAGPEFALGELGPADPGVTRLPPHEQREHPPATTNPTASADPYPTPYRPAASARPAADFDAPGDVDPDDHFVPDEPESWRTLSRTTLVALVILGIGIVALATSGLAAGLIGGYTAPLSLVGTGAVLVGVGMLVTRLRGHRDDSGDDGAVL